MDCGAQDCPEEELSVDPEENKEVIYCWKEEAPAPTSTTTTTTTTTTATTATTTTATTAAPEDN